jgi:radical SAM superfamily enzyme YgiQ (UPF0313 family)
MKNLLQVGRGCPTGCEFCSVTAFNGKKMRNFRIDQLLKDIDEMAGDRKGLSRLFFFPDDNIVGNPRFATEFFEALKGMKIYWYSQATIQLARNEKLLKLASDSGCCGIFYGFESIRQDGVYSVGKKFKVQEYEDIIKKTHDHGIIMLYGSFIFGLEGDTVDVFDRTADFCIKNQVEFMQFSFLTPLPGTKLWHKLEHQGTQVSRDWWKYDFFNSEVMAPDDEVLKRNNLTHERARELWVGVYKKVYSEDGIRARLSGGHSQAEFMNAILYPLNYNVKYLIETHKNAQVTQASLTSA